MKYITIIFISTLILAWGCASESPDSQVTVLPIEHLPQSYGRPNQIYVVADSSLWQSEVGDSFYYYYSAPWLLLPQPEPIFDIQLVEPKVLEERPAKKEFKSFIFLADLTDEDSPTTRMVIHDVGKAKLEEAREKGYTTIVGQNKWALDQQLFYIVGYGPDKLIENIGKNFPPVARRINERDLKMIESNTYQTGNNHELEDEIAASFGIKMRIPGSFQKILYEPKTNTVWLRSDDREVISSLLIHRRKYSDEKQLSYEGIKAIRNEVGKIIESPIEGSYMQINDVDLPLFVEKKTINGHYAVQARGIWEMVKDFKGGAFISNLLLDEDNNELIFVDGFLYGPGLDKKRNRMQELELIISTVQPLEKGEN